MYRSLVPGPRKWISKRKWKHNRKMEMRTEGKRKWFSSSQAVPTSWKPWQCKRQRTSDYVEHALATRSSSGGWCCWGPGCAWSATEGNIRHVRSRPTLSIDSTAVTCAAVPIYAYVSSPLFRSLHIPVRPKKTMKRSPMAMP